MYHQHFAGNCIEQPGERCFTNGLGPHAFDCSGFILRTLCDVAGGDVAGLPKDVRHVRDMWQAATDGVGPFRTARELAVGNLLVTQRCYTVGEERVIIPGHIGIITGIDELSFVHASPPAGKVEERQLMNTDTILGSIAIRL